jgi:DNA-binding transcriptional LysR family regulator
MNWERLKVFHQVARAGSFTNAAFQMNISQSSLSRTIMQLEHELKTRLFHRLPHGLDSTPQGKNLYTVTTRMFHEAEAVENLFAQEKNDPAGLLRIVTTISLASMWFPYYTLGFYEKYPDMRLVISGNDDNLDLNLTKADVSIRTFIPQQPDLIQNYLITLTPKFFASRDYLKKHGEPKTIEELDNHCLLTGGTMENIRQPFLRVNTGPGLLKMAEQGMGILVMSDQYPAVQESSLIPLLQDYEGPGTKIYYSYPKQMKGLKRIEVLNSYLQEVLNTKKA